MRNLCLSLGLILGFSSQISSAGDISKLMDVDKRLEMKPNSEVAKNKIEESIDAGIKLYDRIIEVANSYGIRELEGYGCKHITNEGIPYLSPKIRSFRLYGSFDEGGLVSYGAVKNFGSLSLAIGSNYGDDIIRIGFIIGPDTEE